MLKMRANAEEAVKKIAAVIFDCDGVMFDSRVANINFYNHLLSRFGLPPMTQEQVAFVHMHTAEQSVNHIFKGTPFADAAQAYRKKMDYSPYIKDMKMEPGLEELLKILKPRVRLAVATNRSNTIERVLDCHAIRHFFDLVISCLNVTHPKPHPESLLKILEAFSIKPQEAFYVGDSSVDCETARSAGVPFIAYKNKALSAEYHVDRLMDIAEKILDLKRP
ncbi:MAG: HAD family hydrolase [Deltaproteobacteria bacterium]|nr:HAD family hydrolase [Deltaproteobacteria bacterium]